MSVWPGITAAPRCRLFHQCRRQRKARRIDAEVDDAALVGVAAQKGRILDVDRVGDGDQVGGAQHLLQHGR
jgi:hypothetical protein